MDHGDMGHGGMDHGGHGGMGGMKDMCQMSVSIQFLHLQLGEEANVHAIDAFHLGHEQPLHRL